MGMPRTAEYIGWDDDEAKRPGASWGCWDCGCEESYVREVSKDSDHVRVRYRQCTRCGAMWETEERRISKGAFFARAETRRYAAFRKSRLKIRRCLMCKEHYMGGTYRQHADTSAAHAKVVAARQRRIKARERRYATRWARAKRKIEKLNRGTTTCKRCGGEYIVGQLRTHHAKTAQHRKVLRDEHNQRRQERRHDRD